MKEILFVKTSQNSAKEFISKFDIIKDISQYKLEFEDLKKYQAIIFTMSVDQHLLFRLKDKIEDFLKNGGRIFMNIHIFKPFLDEINEFKPMKYESFLDFKITLLHPHRIYRDINIEKLFKRKGVAGFFSRGENPPPKNALKVAAIKEKSIVADWELEVGQGKLYIHAGNDLWGCFEKEEDNFRFFKNIISWLKGED